MSTPTSQPRRSARKNTTTAPDPESESDHAPPPVKSPKSNKGRTRFQSNADEVASKCKKKDEDNNNDTGDDSNPDADNTNASGNNTTGGDEMLGVLGRVAQETGQGGKAWGRGGKRGGKGKKRYVIKTSCLLATG